MTSKTKAQPVKQSSHRPFVIRKTIVFSAMVLAAVGGILCGNPVLAMALYFGLVTLFDAISYYVCDLKASDYTNAKKLLKFEKVTGQELDTYFDTRRNIRMNSFCMASVALFLAFVNSFYPLESFCLAYMLSTMAGILYVRIFVNINRPRLIYRNGSYDHPTWLVQRPSGAHADFALWSSGYDVPLRF